MNTRNKGFLAAISSALFLGFSPIFGKQSFILGFSPLAVVAIRTSIALLFLLIFLLVFKRTFFTIYPIGLVGCLVAGIVNGLGSILYYTGLSRIDASVGQLLYSFYPLFVALLLLIDRQKVSKITILRLALVIPGVFLLLQNRQHRVDLFGAAMMVGAALFYALHLIINQRILYEAPAPTVTFYTLLAMSITVGSAFLIFKPVLPTAGTNWWPVILMGIITFLSRITLFLGVKQIGGLHTAIIGLGEILITVLLAHLFLHEEMSIIQWVGAALICFNIILLSFDKADKYKRHTNSFLSWLNPSSITPTDFPYQG